jgi:CPA2 family monovalent cation:H+ antiporter-2
LRFHRKTRHCLLCCGNDTYDRCLFLLTNSFIYLSGAMWRLFLAKTGLASIIGYLAAGMAIGPGVWADSNVQDILHFAESGVVLMS